MPAERPVRVWVTVEYRPPDYLGPSFFTASEVRGGLREAGLPSYLFAVERDLASLRSPDFLDVVFPIEENAFKPGHEADPAGLRRALEELGLAFVGSGSAAVRRAGEKDEAKAILAGQGLAVPGGVCLRDRDSAPRGVEEFLDRFPGPAILKPVSGRGGSLGVQYLPDAASLRQAVDRWRQGGEGPVLIEEFVDGTEVTAWVTGVEPEPRCTSVVEIAKHGAIYDRDSKAGRTPPHSKTVPSRLSEEGRNAVAAAVVRAHRALGAYSYSRTDVIVCGGVPVILEVNTRPTLGSEGGLAISDGRPESFGEVMAELVGHALVRPEAPAAGA